MKRINYAAILTTLISTVCASRIMADVAQTNQAATQLAPAANAGIITKVFAPFFDQLANNPASVTVLVFLWVMAYILDDTPIINSRYVSHITIAMGMGIYWMFAGTDSVPHYYPHPFAVLVVNGSVAGIVAAITHRYLITYCINWLRNKFGLDQVPVSQRFLREPTSPTSLFSIGQPKSEHPQSDK